MAPLHPLVEEWDAELRSADPLRFPGYAEKLAALEQESARTGRTEHYALAELRFEVLGGSVGLVAGERIVRAYQRAVDLRLPMVVVTATGGSRMQEGMLSLIQMARTADAAAAHAAAGLLSVAVLRSPTTGGPYASFVSLADLRVASPGATIGFAGPRVVEDTTGEKLPAGAHTAESAFEHGLVDAVVAEADQATWVETALGLRPAPFWRTSPPENGGEVRQNEDGGAWEEVRRARAADRPTGIDWAARLCSSWTELRGADPVVRAGLATVTDRRVVVVAMDRHAGDGRPRPAGYRLAQRAIGLAGRLGLPLLTLVDTPGAHPGHESEVAGLAGEIARTFAAMATVPTPTVSVCVGEGGSGGALAMAAADRFLMQRHAVFSVIAPEGAASILHRDASRAPDVAPSLRLTSADLVELGIVDATVEEDDAAMAEAVAAALDVADPGDRRRRFEGTTARFLQ